MKYKVLFYVFLILLGVSLTAVPLQGQEIPDSERAALIALYNATNGDNWINNSGWKGNNPEPDGFSERGSEGSWYGVDVSGGSSPHVISISQGGNRLTGSIPASLGNLPYLQNLHLNGNQLSGAIPGELGNLAGLKVLNLDGNSLSANIPPELANLGNLQDFILSSNRLGGSLPTFLHLINSLRNIQLHSNRFTGTLPGEWGSLTNLQTLTLHRNILNGNIPTEWNNLSSLQTFHIYSNQLSGDLPLSLTNLTNLSSSETDIGYNGFYTNNPTLRAFLNSKDPDWEDTQTVAPNGVSASALSTSSIRVVWELIPYDGPGWYKVYSSTVSGGPWTFVGESDKSLYFYDVTGLSADTTYYFVVKTQTDPHPWNDNTILSDYSEETSATTNPELGTFTLTVQSSPETGVSITVTPDDNNGDGNGTTNFTRTYDETTVVELTAPADYNGNDFSKWTVDGVDNANRTIQVTITGDHTVTAVYESPSGIKINSLKSKYDGTPHFVAGVNFTVVFTADVDWGNKTPSKVRFITPKGSYDVPTSGATASQIFNIATDFNACTTLKAIAVSKDGTQSAEKAADMVVTPKFLSSIRFNHYNINEKQYYYKTDFGLNIVSEETRKVHKDIPLFGENNFVLKFVPDISAEVSMKGNVEGTLNWSNVSIKKMKIAGLEFNLNPAFQMKGTFNYSLCSYDWSGSISLSANAKGKRTWPFTITVGLIPIPMYTKVSFIISVSETFSLEDISPVTINGEFGPDIKVRGTLGAGIDELINVEGWLQAGPELVLQFPQKPVLKKFIIRASAGISAAAYHFVWENEVLTWYWDIYSPDSRTAQGPTGFSPGKPTLIPRGYLKTRGTFNGTNASSPLQSSVLPYSHAHLSSNDTQMSLVWVRDDSSRSSINRTAAVYSSYNGSNWSTPQTIRDDGTADFHPKSVTFPDGTAAAVWEDVKKELTDNAQLDDVLENMEISVSLYNPNTNNWESSQRITSNHYFDFAPKISGNSINSVMIVWLANESNEIRGSAADPTTIYYSIYDGTNWMTAAPAAQVPMGVLKYDLLYNGTNGYIVLSLDTDDDPSTIDDHELYLLTYENGTWGSLTRLTDDNVVDGNPGLARDSYGNIVLTWVKEDGVYSTTNFEMNNKTTVFSEEYSSSLGDLKTVSSRNGRLAMIWAEASDNYSDLYVSLYDKAGMSWTAPEQVTSDTETERNITAAFYGENTLVSVYNRNNIVETPASTTTAAGKMLSYVEPEIVGTDLVMVKLELEEEEVPHPTIQLNRVHLYFGAVINGACTGPQAVLISNSGTGILNWSADDNASWLQSTPSSGINWGELTVSVDAAGLAAGTYTGTVTVSDPSSTNSQQSVQVTLNVYRSGGSSSPFGEFSTPVDGSNVRSSVPVTGWILDDIGVESVGIFREEGSSLVFIGNAVFVEGARPDIEQAYPGYPLNHSAGWGYMMLTNFLPGGGNGTFRIHAIAVDIEGHHVDLGGKTITVDNANAVKPFGAIDTPGQGGTASGSDFRNHGWVLTPMPNSIPTDGSTINVFVDGVDLGHPAYNVYRSDVAELFPGYANSDGAHAYFDFDTTAYENGIHNIYWIVEDSAGNSDGIGSRYFAILNTGTSRASSRHTLLSQLADIPVKYPEAVRIKTGFESDSESRVFTPDDDGVIHIEIRELERIEIEVSRNNAVISGYLVVGDQLRRLPVGSTLDLDAGKFYWHAGPGFIGEYRLVFIEKGKYNRLNRKNVTVNITPRRGDPLFTL